MDSGYLVNRKKVNKIKSIVALEKLRSDYFLKLLFNNLEKKKLLEIIKYNNNLKKRINININDYLDYSELIEIEIKPKYNKYAKYINIEDKDKPI